MKRYISLLLLVLIVAPNLQIAEAASSLDIIINEVAWMGSAEDSSAEWIELKNNTSSEIDLTGWAIHDDETTTYALSGTISANGYLVIGRYATADITMSLSLANSGDTLVLKDSAGATIDTVNPTGGDWPAGDNTTKASMERISATATGDDNWGDCTSGTGTPSALNSVSESSTGTEVILVVSDSMPTSGDTITVTATVENVIDLFSYGLDMDYDASVLEYQSISQGTFLSASATTSFNAELENGTEGTLVVGEAITQTDRAGVSGDGTLFQATFLVKDNPGASTAITISENFLANTESDIEADFTSTSIIVEASAGQISNATIAEGAERYSLALSWDAPAEGATSYRVLRLNSQGDYEELGTASGTTYTDTSYLVPDTTYTYQIITILGTSESSAVSVTGSETRGVKGDNNRSDRVDGRDLENLAKHYGENYLDESYEQLIDTTYDGNINGSDLIDIGLNWATTYSE